MNRIFPPAFVLAILVQQVFGYARSRIVFKAVDSNEGITSAGMHIGMDYIFMFPALEVFERGADPIVVYYKDDKCHDENEFRLASVPVTIVQQFISNGEWRNRVIQEGSGDITMEKNRSSIFTLIKSGRNEWTVVAEQWWEPGGAILRAVQKGGTTADSSLKIGALDTAVRLRMLNAFVCEHASQGLVLNNIPSNNFTL